MRFCIDCKEIVDDDFPYALCYKCQEEGKCHHGIPYKECCGDCDMESDLAYDAMRERG